MVEESDLEEVEEKLEAPLLVKCIDFAIWLAEVKNGEVEMTNKET